MPRDEQQAPRNDTSQDASRTAHQCLPAFWCRLLRGCARELLRVAGERPIVSGQMMREGGEADRDRFTLAPEIDERESEKRSHGVVEFVAGRLQFRGQQVGGVLRVAQIAQRTGQLNAGSATTYAGQTGGERGLIQGNGPIGMAGGILSGAAFE